VVVVNVFELQGHNLTIELLICKSEQTQLSIVLSQCEQFHYGLISAMIKLSR